MPKPKGYFIEIASKKINEDIRIFLLREYIEKNRTPSDIAKQLNICKGQLFNYLNFLNIHKRTEYTKEWHHDEIKFIKENYDCLTDKEIALKLNKTISQVGYLRMKFNIEKDMSSIVKNQFDNGRQHPFLGKTISQDVINKRLKTIKERYGNIPAWNKGLTKEIDVRVKKYGEKQKGKIVSLETRNKLRESAIMSYNNGRIHPMLGKTKETSLSLKKMSERMKTNNPMKNPEVVKRANNMENMKKRFKSMIKKPTKPEKTISDLIKENNLPFIYTGNGAVIIGGFNPDFLSEELKKIIEVNGDYWHNLPKNKSRDKYKYENYNRHGYKTLVIWEKEIKENKDLCLNKIKEFSENE